MENVLEKIHKAALKFLIPLNPEETYKYIVDEAVKLVRGQYGSILLEQSGELARVYSSSPYLYRVESGLRGPLGNKDPRYEVFKKRKPIVLGAQQMKDLKKKFPGLRSFDDRAAIMIPLSYRNKSMGILSVIALKNGIFTDRELDMLTLFGSLASLAIRKTQLYDETKQVLASRDLFFAMAAHELRTPVTTILGYAQLLSSKLSGEDSKEAGWIKDLSYESMRLAQLVTELLIVNKIRAGKLTYSIHKTDLIEIIRRAISRAKFTYPNCQFKLVNKTNKKLAYLKGDSEKLLQVFINLLDNSAKFSNDKPVTITMKKSRLGFEVIVTDQGRGISQEDLPKVFEGFYQGSSGNKEGLGLGLFLTKNILDYHKAKVKVQSRLGKGTKISVNLPKG